MNMLIRKFSLTANVENDKNDKNGHETRFSSKAALVNERHFFFVVNNVNAFLLSKHSRGFIQANKPKSMLDNIQTQHKMSKQNEL